MVSFQLLTDMLSLLVQGYYNLKLVSLASLALQTSAPLAISYSESALKSGSNSP